MKIHRIKIMLVLLVLIAALAIANLPVHASHDCGPPPGTPCTGTTGHSTEPIPNPPGSPIEAVCTVQGTVSIPEGVGTTPGHNHFTFVDTDIDCIDSNSGGTNFTDTYDVTASGPTDGPDHPLSDPPPDTPNGDPDHGEDCERGWSAGPGSITATGQRVGPPAPLSGSGSVEFTRAGTAVTAWGTINFGVGVGSVEFIAVLQFTPNVGQTCATAGGVGSEVTGARLDGSAIIGR